IPMHRSRSRSLRIACFAVVAFGARAAAALQAAPTPTTGAPPSSAAFAERVDVELVTVDVWVSDRQGRSVSGLAARDFQLLQDGEPVTITNFAELRGPAATSMAAAAAPPAGPAPQQSSAADPTPSAEAAGY